MNPNATQRSAKSGMPVEAIARRGFALLIVGASVFGFGGCGEGSPAPSSNATASASTSASSAAGAPGGAAATAAPASTVHTVGARSGSFWVRWSCAPEPMPVSDPFSLRLELFADAACTVPLVPLDAADPDATVVSVDAAMPHHGHGMNVRPKVTRAADGSYLVTGMLFHMPGRWELMFDVTRDGLLERAQTTVELAFGSGASVGAPGGGS